MDTEYFFLIGEERRFLFKNNLDSKNMKLKLWLFERFFFIYTILYNFVNPKGIPNFQTYMKDNNIFRLRLLKP